MLKSIICQQVISCFQFFISLFGSTQILQNRNTFKTIPCTHKSQVFHFNFPQNAHCLTSFHLIGKLFVKGNTSKTHRTVFVASCTWDLCIHGFMLLTFCLWISQQDSRCSSCWWASLHFPVTIVTMHTVHVSPIMAFSEAIFHIFQALSRCTLLKSSNMYFEYSKCRTFCEFLIYVYEWFLFSLPWQRSVIFSPLQIVSMVKYEPHFFSPFV